MWPFGSPFDQLRPWAESKGKLEGWNWAVRQNGF